MWYLNNQNALRIFKMWFIFFNKMSPFFFSFDILKLDDNQNVHVHILSWNLAEYFRQFRAKYRYIIYSEYILYIIFTIDRMIYFLTLIKIRT